MMPNRSYYWWIGAEDPETGHFFLIYGAPDHGPNGGEDAARSKAFEMLGGVDFTLRRLPTRDRGTASALWRGERLEQTHSLREAHRRLGHEKSVNRWRQRRLARGGF